jgi:hypothetical protein
VLGRQLESVRAAQQAQAHAHADVGGLEQQAVRALVCVWGEVVWLRHSARSTGAWQCGPPVACGAPPLPLAPPSPPPTGTRWRAGWRAWGRVWRWWRRLWGFCWFWII